jgi:hypothetical protein
MTDGGGFVLRDPWKSGPNVDGLKIHRRGKAL